MQGGDLGLAGLLPKGIGTPYRASGLEEGVVKLKSEGFESARTLCVEPSTSVLGWI
jgi:hypothetical protein